MLLHLNLKSESLGRYVSADVLLPQAAACAAGGAPVRTLWLLHGVSDDNTGWQRRTAIERYAEKYDLAVVMPNGERAWYTDALHGCRMYTFIAEELPRLLRGLFRNFSDRKEDNYIAGLSMGGFGALKIALRNPDRYAAIATFSAALAIDSYIAPDGKYHEELGQIFGSYEAFRGSENDPFFLAQQAAKADKRLPIYQWCGTEDKLLESNRRFAAHLKTLGYDLDYRESAGGHQWCCWDEQIELVLDKWFAPTV